MASRLCGDDSLPRTSEVSRARSFSPGLLVKSTKSPLGSDKLVEGCGDVMFLLKYVRASSTCARKTWVASSLTALSTCVQMIEAKSCVNFFSIKLWKNSSISDKTPPVNSRWETLMTPPQSARSDRMAEGMGGEPWSGTSISDPLMLELLTVATTPPARLPNDHSKRHEIASPRASTIAFVPLLRVKMSSKDKPLQTPPFSSTSKPITVVCESGMMNSSDASQCSSHESVWEAPVWRN
mmetsp:Transcript_46696/g.117527  ORF Transcript_46696/g.117527 Transcript_46696/m.117527 type:complete len:238 (-) Transcript_46696:162-875(-)